MKPTVLSLCAAICLSSCATTGGRDEAPRAGSSGRIDSARPAVGAVDARALAASELRVAGVEVDQVGVSGVTLVFALEATPKGAGPAVLTRVDASLTSGGRHLQAGAAEPKAVLPAKTKTAVPYRLRVDFADILQRDRSFRPGAVLTCVVALTAVFTGVDGERKNPAVAAVDVPIPATPRLALSTAAISGTSAERVAGVLVCIVDNDNAFPLDVDRLSYSILVAGRDIGTGALDGRPSLNPRERVRLELPFAFDPRTAPEAAAALRGESAPVAVSGTLQALSPYGVLVFAVGEQAQIVVTRSGR